MKEIFCAVSVETEGQLRKVIHIHHTNRSTERRMAVTRRIRNKSKKCRSSVQIEQYLSQWYQSAEFRIVTSRDNSKTMGEASERRALPFVVALPMRARRPILFIDIHFPGSKRQS